MTEDLETLRRLVEPVLTEWAPRIEAGAGSVALDTKDATAEETHINTAVTELDRGLQDAILRVVVSRAPHWRILAEEDTELARMGNRDGDTSLVLDPIDGTAEFAAGRPGYTSMFALTNGGRIVGGAIAQYAPLRITERAPMRPLTHPNRLFVHYRFTKPRHRDTADRLRAAGFELVATPGPEIGSNGQAILDVLEGRAVGWLAPDVTLHDLAGPWGVLVRSGGHAVRFAATTDDDPAWRPAIPDFSVPVEYDYPARPVRHRVLLARSATHVDRILGILRGTP